MLIFSMLRVIVVANRTTVEQFFRCIEGIIVSRSTPYSFS